MLANTLDLLKRAVEVKNLRICRGHDCSLQTSTRCTRQNFAACDAAEAPQTSLPHMWTLLRRGSPREGRHISSAMHNPYTAKCGHLEISLLRSTFRRCSRHACTCSARRCARCLVRVQQLLVPGEGGSVRSPYYLLSVSRMLPTARLQRRAAYPRITPSPPPFRPTPRRQALLTLALRLQLWIRCA